MARGKNSRLGRSGAGRRTPSRRSPQRIGSTTRSSIIWGLAATTLVALAGGAFWQVRSVTKQEAIDTVTLCPLSSGATQGLTILLDLTDPLSATQAAALRLRLGQEFDEAPRGTRIAIGQVSHDPEEWGAGIVICKPMTGMEAGDLIRNSDRIEAQYQSKFRDPLDAKLEQAMTTGTADQSPIIEALQALLVGAATIPLASGAREEVLIVSDMIQNSATLSFYRGGSWETFREAGGEARLARSLSGIAVSILRLPRSEASVDTADVDDFWVNYLEAQGATSVSPQVLGDL